MTNHDVLLNNGAAMPLLGLGVFRTSSQEEMNHAVQWAWEAGYRSFDTAQMYGNENLLGNALRSLALLGLGPRVGALGLGLGFLLVRHVFLLT